MIKKGIVSLVLVLTLMVTSINTFALTVNDLPNDENYSIVSVTADTTEVIQTAKTYKGAVGTFDRLKDQYENLTIVNNGKVIKAEYGIAQIASTPACDYNVEFRNDLDNGSNYTNGCYGVDAAYLDTNDNGTKVKFMISGVVGWANISDITIIPVQMLPTRISTYVVKEGFLFHQIKTTFSNDLYSALINVGHAPDYLVPDVEYYSYDGHYFYDDNQLLVMLDDLKQDRHANSVNVNNPYYNYYQYVSHRTHTNVTEDEVISYFQDSLGIDQSIDTYLDLDKDSSTDALNKSQFYDEEYSFFQYQNQYGANALMMLALSMNETAIGRSSLSFTRNNLFGHAAYDSDVEKNASRYFSTNSSVYSHAKYYISGSYANPLRFQFHGSFFGNKANGMNVSYASDPYWGEKAAQFYLKVDESFGFKDYNAYALGIKTDTNDVSVYQYDTTTSPVLYKTGIVPGFSFVILDAFTNAEGDWYKIQSEATLNDQSQVDMMYYYDYENYTGYIKQSDVQVVLNADKLGQRELIDVSFDANGGLFQDESQVIQYKIETGKKPSIEDPVKDKSLFIGWDKQLDVVNESTSYVAQYEDVDRIEMKTMPVQLFEYNDRINIENGELSVYLSNGKEKTIPLTTSMISGFDLKTEGKQEVIVEYAGSKTSYEIEVNMELDTIRQELKAEILSVIEEMETLETLTQEQVDRVFALKLKMDQYMVPYLTQPQLRALDGIIYKAIDHQIHYVIYKNDLDASVSGLSLSIDLEDSMNKKMFKDTYKLVVKDSIKKDHLKKVTDLAVGNGYTVLDSFKIQTQKNLENFTLHAPVLISIKKPENATPNQLFTVLLYDDGDIVKCYTRQTDNYIQFMTPKIGEFVITSRNTTNEYVIDDVIETVRVDNSDPDIPALIAAGLGALVILLGAIALIDYLIKKRRRSKHDHRENRDDDSEENTIE